MPDLSNAVTGAQSLLGWELIHHTPEGICGGIITETEAYRQDDEASHSFRGITPRTEPMFKSAGHVYVYFTYGMHWCMNIVAGEHGSGEAVLLRALQPTRGIELMMQRRNTNDVHRLTPGPATITQALAIPSAYSGVYIADTTLELIPPKKAPAIIKSSSRVGIKKAIDKQWRFYI